MTRPLMIRGEPIAGGGEPLVCAPVVGRDETAVLDELAYVVAKVPDIIEWRVDFFSGIHDARRVLELARRFRTGAGSIPIIFTGRSDREGGQPVAASAEQVMACYREVSRAGCVDFIDCELDSDPSSFATAVSLARETGVQLIASFHDFERTPPLEAIVAKLAAMEAAGADIAKIAVMPRDPRDVLTLMQATLDARERITIPIVSISMGAYGSLSRLYGWMFGSSVSFAVAHNASAPGQVPIEDLRAVLGIVQYSLRDDDQVLGRQRSEHHAAQDGAADAEADVRGEHRPAHQ